MLRLVNNSDTIIVVLHEIYGINDHIVKVCQELHCSGFDVACPNLLGRDKPFSYNEEAAAYRHFMDNVGFKCAAKLVTDLLMKFRHQYRRILLIGYSVGATTGWLCCKDENICDGFIGFYGSRIRDYLDIVPKRPVLLFFPEEEKSFNTNELAAKLSYIKNIEVHILEGGHGFADPFSINFNQQLHNAAKAIMKRFLNITEDH